MFRTSFATNTSADPEVEMVGGQELPYALLEDVSPEVRRRRVSPIEIANRMSKKYTVLVVGMGKRGMHHAAAFNANPRFQVVGLCDIDPAKLQAAAPKLGNPQTGADARALAATLKPDVFCFCTLPNLRADLIRVAWPD